MTPDQPNPAPTTLLIVVPDYASHVLPMMRVGVEWAQSTGSVVVATGQATRPLVEAANLEWIELRLGKGSNDGVIDEGTQPAGEDLHLRAFFDATRAGPVATLRYQADARLHDLLFEPDRVMDRLAEILDQIRPDRVVVDHVAFGARLALHALGLHPATMVLGHPSALPGAGEVYGLPPVWPVAMRPSDSDVEDLKRRCLASVEELSNGCHELLTRQAAKALVEFDDSTRYVADTDSASLDLTGRPGNPTIYVYPSELVVDHASTPTGSVFLGSLSRDEQLGDVQLPTGTGPRVTVALGSFLSARSDVLATIVAAACVGGWRLALAYGSSDPALLGPFPDGSLIARHIPQVALLAHTDVVIHHGGNGSVTESIAAGVPMVVLPFSTDQFAGAAAIERSGLGVVLAPNDLTVQAVLDAVDQLLASDGGLRARQLAAAISQTGGPAAAVAAIARTPQEKWA